MNISHVCSFKVLPTLCRPYNYPSDVYWVHQCSCILNSANSKQVFYTSSFRCNQVQANVLNLCFLINQEHGCPDVSLLQPQQDRTRDHLSSSQVFMRQNLFIYFKMAFFIFIWHQQWNGRHHSVMPKWVHGNHQQN